MDVKRREEAQEEEKEGKRKAKGETEKRDRESSGRTDVEQHTLHVHDTGVMGGRRSEAKVGTAAGEMAVRLEEKGREEWRIRG
jgi:hypothetical protein